MEVLGAVVVGNAPSSSLTEARKSFLKRFEGEPSRLSLEPRDEGEAAFAFDQDVQRLLAGLGTDGVGLQVAEDLADKGGARPLGDVVSIRDFGGGPPSDPASVPGITGLAFPGEILNQVFGLVINVLVDGLVADRLTRKIELDPSAHLLGGPTQGDLLFDVSLDLSIF